MQVLPKKTPTKQTNKQKAVDFVFPERCWKCSHSLQNSYFQSQHLAAIRELHLKALAHSFLRSDVAAGAPGSVWHPWTLAILLVLSRWLKASQVWEEKTWLNAFWGFNPLILVAFTSFTNLHVMSKCYGSSRNQIESSTWLRWQWLLLWFTEYASQGLKKVDVFIYFINSTHKKECIKESKPAPY